MLRRKLTFLFIELLALAGLAGPIAMTIGCGGNHGMTPSDIRNVDANGDPTLVPAGKTFRVATFNIKNSIDTTPPGTAWADRKDLVFAAIRETDPDLIGLQEVTEEQHTDLLAAFPMEYHWLWSNGVPTQGDSLMLGVKLAPGDTVDGEGLADLQHGGVKPERIQFWVRTKYGRVATTHMSGTSTEAEAFAPSLRAQDNDLLFGDFNSPASPTNPWGLPYVLPIFEQNNFNDLWAEATPNNTRPSGCGYQGDCPDFGIDARIDWILGKASYHGVKSGMVNKQRNGVNASDHMLVWADITRE